MLHKAWRSIGEVPYCFPGSSIKFQGHTCCKIDLNPIWARLLGRSQLSNPSDMPCLNENCCVLIWISLKLFPVVLLTIIQHDSDNGPLPNRSQAFICTSVGLVYNTYMHHSTVLMDHVFIEVDDRKLFLYASLCLQNMLYVLNILTCVEYVYCTV